MYILKPVTQPNGAQTLVHRISRVEIMPLDPLRPQEATSVSIQVSSFVDDGTTSLSWQASIPMPLEDFSASTYPGNVIEFLTAAGGALEGGELVTDADTDLDRAQKTAFVRIAKLREDHIAAGFSVEGVGTFESDALSIRNITGKAQRASVAITRNEEGWATPWKLADNSMAELDASGMIAVGEALDAHITACYARSWVLKAQIGAAEDTAAVEAIVLDTDWP